MKISLVLLTDTFLKVHLKKLRNVILGASIVSNKFETWPWCNRAALARDRIQPPVPAPYRRFGLLCQIVTEKEQSSHAVEGSSMNQPTSQGSRMSHPEHPATMTAETCSCDRRGHHHSISHLNEAKMKGYLAHNHLSQEQASQLKISFQRCFEINTTLDSQFCFTIFPHTISTFALRPPSHTCGTAKKQLPDCLSCQTTGWRASCYRNRCSRAAVSSHCHSARELLVFFAYTTHWNLYPSNLN